MLPSIEIIIATASQGLCVATSRPGCLTLESPEAALDAALNYLADVMQRGHSRLQIFACILFIIKPVGAVFSGFVYRDRVQASSFKLQVADDPLDEVNNIVNTLHTDGLCAFSLRKGLVTSAAGGILHGQRHDCGKRASDLTRATSFAVPLAPMRCRRHLSLAYPGCVRRAGAGTARLGHVIPGGSDVVCSQRGSSALLALPPPGYALCCSATSNASTRSTFLPDPLPPLSSPLAPLRLRSRIPRSRTTPALSGTAAPYLSACVALAPRTSPPLERYPGCGIAYATASGRLTFSSCCVPSTPAYIAEPASDPATACVRRRPPFVPPPRLPTLPSPMSPSA
ncbi:hypothetical protein B0H15DRAFT_1024245 [Mycena belliarum]|uniref:Uncharacterized protein n=1 Tax=Mycena belliarum TaxID=1033014 RepID=A0AAD6U0U9_9AGAR|nr:hypothetical protein B0H15DRAFT_1024245 [Mycena belliae]